MLPTIDISLVGIAIAVWGFIRTLWGYFCGALNWLTQRAIALVIGSKMWATAAFVAVAIFVIGILSTFISFVFGVIQDKLSVGSLSVGDDVLSLIGLYIDGDGLFSLISFSVSTIVTYYLVVGVSTTRNGLLRIYTILTRAWKV